MYIDIKATLLGEDGWAKSYDTEHASAILHGNVRVQKNCILGLNYKPGCAPAQFSDASVIRSGTTIYADVRCADHLQTGHNVTIREHTQIGRYVVVGTNTVIDGQVSIGDFVKIETNCYIPTHVKIGNRVFIGPNVTMTNDAFPLKMRSQYVPDAPILHDGVTVGGGATLCPGVEIGKGSFIAAGAVVTKDIPAYSLVLGVPGEIRPLPEKLREPNIALNWWAIKDELPEI